MKKYQCEREWSAFSDYSEIYFLQEGYRNKLKWGMYREDCDYLPGSKLAEIICESMNYAHEKGFKEGYDKKLENPDDCKLAYEISILKEKIKELKKENNFLKKRCNNFEEIIDKAEEARELLPIKAGRYCIKYNIEENEND